VLAGDPKQLGPVLMSPFAKMYGLELSLLERLMERLPYQYNEQLYSEHGGFHSALVIIHNFLFCLVLFCFCQQFSGVCFYTVTPTVGVFFTDLLLKPEFAWGGL
jgi:hypothetical protein